MSWIISFIALLSLSLKFSERYQNGDEAQAREATKAITTITTINKDGEQLATKSDLRAEVSDLKAYIEKETNRKINWAVGILVVVLAVAGITTSVILNALP